MICYSNTFWWNQTRHHLKDSQICRFDVVSGVTIMCQKNWDIEAKEQNKYYLNVTSSEWQIAKIFTNFRVRYRKTDKCFQELDKQKAKYDYRFVVNISSAMAWVEVIKSYTQSIEISVQWFNDQFFWQYLVHIKRTHFDSTLLWQLKNFFNF